MKMSMNPFCEIALEEAIKLKEKKQVENITALTIGPKASEQILRTALAMGATEAVHIQTDLPLDSEV